MNYFLHEDQTRSLTSFSFFFTNRARFVTLTLRFLVYFICIYSIYNRLPLWAIVSINLAQSGAHNSERATPILGLCHGPFPDQFIFRHILGHLFPQKQKLHHTYERIGSTRYQKGIKALFLGLRVFLTGLCLAQ